MKSYIFILLIVFVFSEHHYKSGVGEIKILKLFYAKSPDRDIFIKKVFDLDIPKDIKEMVNNLHYISKDFKSNIDLKYNSTVGGYAKGEISYYFKESGYNFIYGIAEAELKPLTSYRKPLCRRPWPILPIKCTYITSFPHYEESTFKSYIAERMKNKLYINKNHNYFNE